MTFYLNPGDDDNETDVGEAVEKLRNAIDSGLVQFTLPNGKNVTADDTWFLTYYDVVSAEPGNML